jgi:hypothetical protein
VPKSQCCLPERSGEARAESKDLQLPRIPGRSRVRTLFPETSSTARWMKKAIGDRSPIPHFPS